jgi:hypothetical protein
VQAGLAGVDCPTRYACYAAGVSQTARGSFPLVLQGT